MLFNLFKSDNDNGPCAIGVMNVGSSVFLKDGEFTGSSISSKDGSDIASSVSLEVSLDTG
jgi:hypothetical protein